MYAAHIMYSLVLSSMHRHTIVHSNLQLLAKQCHVFGEHPLRIWQHSPWMLFDDGLAWSCVNFRWNNFTNGWKCVECVIKDPRKFSTTQYVCIKLTQMASDNRWPPMFSFFSKNDACIIENKLPILHENDHSSIWIYIIIRELVDCLCRDGADVPYMQSWSKSLITWLQKC